MTIFCGRSFQVVRYGYGYGSSGGIEEANVWIETVAEMEPDAFRDLAAIGCTFKFMTAASDLILPVFGVPWKKSSSAAGSRGIAHIAASGSP
jgi:hypothetical protein